MNLPYIGAAELSALVGPAEAVDALERAFRDEDPGAGPMRSHLTVPDGELLVMPASAEVGVGVKLVTLTQANPARGLPFIHGVYVFFARETLQPVAIVDGAGLTALRTAAVSALATRYLAREDAARLVVFGAGVQARAHVSAMLAVRPISEVVIVGRDAARARALIESLREEGIAASAGAPDAVGGADVVCTCTTSHVPLFDSAWLAAGAHVNAIGAYRPDMRELEAGVLRGAKVVVETRESALLEAGDVVWAMREGALDAGALHELGDVVNGRVGRDDGDEVTVFKSVGLALEDLAIVATAAERLATGGARV